MTTGLDKPWVSFEPVALGPFEIAGLTGTGILLALAFLLSLGSSARLARARSLPARLPMEIHALAVPAALLAAWSPALVGRWSDVLAAPESWAEVLSRPPSLVAGAVAVLVLVVAWARLGRRPWLDVLDVLSPGALAGWAAWRGRELWRAGSGEAWPMAVAALGAVLAARVVSGESRTGEAALVAIEFLLLARWLPELWLPGPPSTGLVAATAVFALVACLHVCLRVTVSRRDDVRTVS